MKAELILNDNQIRRTYDESSRTWYFSVVDTIAIVTESSDPRNYWKVLKSRLYKANPELVTRCNQLKLAAADGKSYLTDTADSETLLEIVSTISDKYVTPLRLYIEKIEATYPHLHADFLKDSGSHEEVELPVDMYETPTAIIIQALVAGSQPEDILISVTYKQVTIKGTRVPPHPNTPYVVQEVYWGTFSRSVDLPTEIQVDTVEAISSHGFLRITLPKIDTLRTRIIKIKSV